MQVSMGGSLFIAIFLLGFVTGATIAGGMAGRTIAVKLKTDTATRQVITFFTALLAFALTLYVCFSWLYRAGPRLGM